MLGENVRRMRSYSNITKTRLALMVSIGRPLLNRIEDGTADVRKASSPVAAVRHARFY